MIQKFRAWDKKENKWVDYPIYIDANGDVYWEHYERGLQEADDLIVMQSAGLVDQEGVEVYFNDIVEDEYGHRYEVVFEGDCLRCNGVSRIRGGHKPKNRWFGRDLKIIGNIYENNDLTKRSDTVEKWRIERVKQILRDYPDTDRYIRKIEESIRTPYKASDVNGDIKGTRMDNDPNFATMWTIETHKQIANFKRNKQIIDDLLYECGADTETIIRELYIKKFPQYTMQGLVDNFMISCGKTKAFQKRNRFFEEVDRMLEI